MIVWLHWITKIRLHILNYFTKVITIVFNFHYLHYLFKYFRNNCMDRWLKIKWVKLIQLDQSSFTWTGFWLSLMLLAFLCVSKETKAGSVSVWMSPMSQLWIELHPFLFEGCLPASIDFGFKRTEPEDHLRTSFSLWRKAGILYPTPQCIKLIETRTNKNAAV